MTWRLVIAAIFAAEGAWMAAAGSWPLGLIFLGLGMIQVPAWIVEGGPQKMVDFFNKM